MVGFQILTRLREETLSVLTDTVGHLLFAGRLTEIGGRTSHIMDITLKIRFPNKLAGFRQKGFVAPGLQNPSLVESKCTEAAATETAAVTDEAEFYLLDGRNPAILFIARVVGSHIRKAVHPVHLLLT